MLIGAARQALRSRAVLTTSSMLGSMGTWDGLWPKGVVGCLPAAEQESAGGHQCNGGFAS